MTDLAHEVPFDQYSRQRQVGIITDAFRVNKNKSFTVLDVGGYKGKTSEFLSKDKVTIMDLFDVKADNYVQGSALKMPFKDKSFDFVMSFDVLEHIQKSDRELFLKECSRVAKRGVIIAAPQKTPANELAEKELNKLYKKLHGEEHPWLKEHIAYTIPDFKWVEKNMQKNGWKTARVPSNDSEMWALMQGAIFLNSKHSLAAEQLIEVNDHYNKKFPLDGGNDIATAYRSILVSSYDANTLSKITDFFTDNKVAISNEDKIGQISEVQNYLSVLLEKMSVLANNYKDLHEHEANRAEQLHKNNEDLMRKIDILNKENTILKGEGATVINKVKARITTRRLK